MANLCARIVCEKLEKLACHLSVGNVGNSKPKAPLASKPPGVEKQKIECARIVWRSVSAEVLAASRKRKMTLVEATGYMQHGS